MYELLIRFMGMRSKTNWMEKYYSLLRLTRVTFDNYVKRRPRERGQWRSSHAYKTITIFIIIGPPATWDLSIGPREDLEKEDSEEAATHTRPSPSSFSSDHQQPFEEHTHLDTNTLHYLSFFDDTSMFLPQHIPT